MARPAPRGPDLSRGYATDTLSTADVARFWRKVDKETGSVHPVLGRCWIWTGARQTTGYGHINLAGTFVGSHRLSYELSFGRIHDGLQVDHLCREKSCVRPDHMEAVTGQVNIERRACSLCRQPGHHATTCGREKRRKNTRPSRSKAAIAARAAAAEVTR